MLVLAGRRVILGVTGGIAAYKAVEIAGCLVKKKTEVQVVMTAAARHFAAPPALETITGRPVESDMFAPRAGGVAHIEMARWGEVMLIAPATANILGKAAAGIADDLLSTLFLAFDRPVLFCPAMNKTMYANPVVQRNIQTLAALGYHFCGPCPGRLACGEEGTGRLPAVDAVIGALAGLVGERDLDGRRIMVTAGPTREPLDPVRYLSNRSSGKMGYAVARAARERGARVILISGPTALASPPGVETVFVETAAEMRRAVLAHLDGCDAVIKAAAVADYRPRERAETKIKKSGATNTVVLEPTPDILAELGRRKRSFVLVGFAAETERLEERAVAKARAKGADLIVANDVTRPGAGFDVDTNIAVFAYPDGRVNRLPLMEKSALAHRILDETATLAGGGGVDDDR